MRQDGTRLSPLSVGCECQWKHTQVLLGGVISYGQLLKVWDGDMMILSEKWKHLHMALKSSA